MPTHVTCDANILCTHTLSDFKSEVLGSRLSRPGSPLAARSQLRSTKRAEWVGWALQLERGWRLGWEKETQRGRERGVMEKSSRGHLSHSATCELLFSSPLCDPWILLHDCPRTMTVLEGILVPSHGLGDPV